MKYLLLPAILLLASCTTATHFPIDQTPFDKALWSILIEEENGQTLYALNADKLMIPASNRKLFAAATIATCLGATTQLSTDVYRDGEDLIVKGDGDPSLGSWRYSREDDFDRLAETLRAKGVTNVRDLVIDVSTFDRVLLPGGWKLGNVGSDYSAPVDAITWGENEIPTDRAVESPALHAGNVLRESLYLRGISVANVRVNTEPRALPEKIAIEKIASIPSPFVAQLLQTVLKNSHNLYAEMLLKRSSNGTYDASFALERALLAGEVHVPRDSFRFVDGSGLAPDNLVSARASIALLRWMNHPSRRAFWWPILAQPNNDGTLRRRLVTLEERLRGKTGTINGVAALSGIIAMPDGRYRYFSVMVNHHIGDGDEAVKIIDLIVEWAARTSPRTRSSS
ncbi:MAG TPA: D-alanyl-D-alanine carboxypeptidase [Thermoanaerobaculia bacterium]|nr:D-alanyl-D-alanine carboxypeptidase [Thermoanaerobaculia bacterium]